MEKFKIDLFEKEHSANFPEFRTLAENETLALLLQICQKYDLTTVTVDIAKELLSKQTYYWNYTDNFKLISVLVNLGIKPLNEVCISFDNFKTIDAFTLTDLNIYLDDIWFPSADDIDIFDHTTDWVLSISHYEAVNFIMK